MGFKIIQTERRSKVKKQAVREDSTNGSFLIVLGVGNMSEMFRKIEEINCRLSKKPWLEPLFTSVLKIPEQINDIDPEFFVVRNTMTRQFEIHSLGNKCEDTLCIPLPYPELDFRAVIVTRRNNIKTRGKRIFQEIDAKNEKMRAEKHKQFRNDVNAIARDTRSVFAKYAGENL